MLLVDTNIFLAAADRRSDRHQVCAAILRDHQGELATTVPVVAEASWLILDRLGPRPQAQLLAMITSGRLHPLDLTDADWARCAELVATYSDLRLDLMDAPLVAIGERHQVSTIATLNRRDFTVVRPRHADSFTLLP